MEAVVVDLHTFDPSELSGWRSVPGRWTCGR